MHNGTKGDDHASQMPDEYDRLFGSLDGLPDVTRTKRSTITVTPPLGVGGSRTFILETVRQRDVGDIVFLQMVGAGGSLRLALLPGVTDAIARQREAVGKLVQRQHGRRIAAERKAAGWTPNTEGLRRARQAKKRGRK